jgi:hypothetical protein
MNDLIAILEARRGDYGKAEMQLDTNGESPEQSLEKLRKLVTPFIAAKVDTSRGTR